MFMLISACQMFNGVITFRSGEPRPRRPDSLGIGAL